ncbi:DUF481 domain-containing protein [Teredinibacter turnerae]|uniref:DUF481 domain-containing protein n=1 Tax=Teredinibacter turnerae TaxID=2426 RepID=UPI00035ED9F0|nr:DUF481 domain-containing protein [Teredinibacter turnerae]
MTNRAVPLFLIPSLFVSVHALATEHEEHQGPVSVDAEVGALLTNGNTQSSAFKGKVDINHELKHWRNEYIVEGLYKRDEVTVGDGDDAYKEDQVTAEKYFFSAQTDYKLNSEYQGVFGYVSYEENKFSGYKYQSTAAFGYSDRAFQGKNQHMDYSVGPGMSMAETEPSEDEDGVYVPADKQEAVILRVSAKYVYRFNPNTKFTQSLSSDIAFGDEDNTRTKSETAITAALNGSFAIKTSFKYEHNSVVSDEDIEQTDTQTAVTFVYTY